MVELTIDNAGVAWRTAGKKLGLSGPGLLAGLQLDGFIGPFDVRVEQQGDQTQIVVRDGRPSALSALRWRVGAARPTSNAVATGDLAFDERVVVHGDPLVIAAFFDASRRRSILRATAGGGSFEDGLLHLQTPEPLGSATPLVSAVRTAVALARRMTAPRNLAACLTSNALRDPVPAVRLNCLDRLCGSSPGPAPRVLRTALRDPDATVRLRAATALPDEGRPVLLALAKNIRLDEPVQAQAIAALVRPPAREMIRILDAAIRRRRRRVAVRAIAALGDSNGRTVLARLAALTRSADTRIRLAAIRALAATRQPGAQDALVRVLGSVSSEAREAAAEGLGVLGTISAVPLLRAAVRAHPLDAGLKRIAHRAIAAIQARALGAKAGQLSIVDGVGVGGLSLTASETGQLSLGPEGTLHPPTSAVRCPPPPRSTRASGRARRPSGTRR